MGYSWILPTGFNWKQDEINSAWRGLIAPRLKTVQLEWAFMNVSTHERPNH